MSSNQKSSGAWKGFMQGSLGAAVGGAAAHPLDLIKVRMQLQGQGAGGAAAPKLNMAQMGVHVFKSQGVGGLYTGVDASIARQLVYSGVRFGVYDVLKDATGCAKQEGITGLISRVGCACLAGAIGAFAGNPGDLVMVRMQADGKLPVEQRRNYRHFFHACKEITKQEGLTSMWRTGLVPNMNRAMIVTVGQLAAYDQCKGFLRNTCGAPDTLPTHFAASFMAAFIASAMSNPVDVAKTRLMNQKAGETLYTGTLQCMGVVAKQEGPLALYKGFPATFARQCPYLVVTFVTVEQLKKLMKDW